MLDGILFQSLHSTSKACTLSVLSTFLYREMKNITALVGGIGILPECLASQLDVRLNTSVTSISTSSAEVELETNAGLITADRVILATTAPIAKTLYLSSWVIERELLDTPYSSTLVITLAMQDAFRLKPDIAGIYGILVPKVERDIISSITFEAAKDKSRLAGGHLLVIFLSGTAGKQMIDWKEDAILPVVLNELDKYIGNVSESIRFTRIYRWNEAMPYSPVGRIKNVARYRESITESTKIFLAGDYLGLPSTEGAAETGKWAADTIIKNLH